MPVAKFNQACYKIFRDFRFWVVPVTLIVEDQNLFTCDMLVDTGGQRTYISTQAWQYLQVQDQGCIKRKGINGISVKVPIGNIQCLKVGTISIKPLTVGKEIPSELQDYNINGIVGVDVLKNFGRVSLNYLEEKIIFETPSRLKESMRFFLKRIRPYFIHLLP